MVQSVREALKYGVAVGAHPGYPDRENFGRTAMDLPPETVYAQTLYQIGALAAIVQAQGGEMQHVKPHGMLYNGRPNRRRWPTRSPARSAMLTRSWCWWVWRAAN